MPLQNVPWATGNNALNPVEGARLSLYAATGGARGVMTPTDMQVTALPVPGPAVRVRTGACVTPNDYPGGGGQSYAMREVSSTDVPVPATGSGGAATRFLIARIQDPQYAGQAPENPQEGPYNSYEWVSSLSGLTYPHVPLARLQQPANTATITPAMLTDIREVANPRTHDVWRSRPNVAADREDLTASGSDGEWFPNGGGEQLIAIPSWATYMLIDAAWMAVRYQNGNNGWGEYWVEWGPYLRPSTRQRSTQRFMWDTAGPATSTYRANWLLADRLWIPPELRGTNQIFIMKARRDPASTNRAAAIDGMSGLSLKVRFLEIAGETGSSS